MPILAYIFFALNVSYAQSNDLSLSTNERSLVNETVSRCEILSDIVRDNNGRGDISATWLFTQLQKTNSDGKLLIDSEDCKDSILNFVSSVCTSNSNQNKVFCAKLGIHRYSADDGNNYKQFGLSAIDSLDISNVETPLVVDGYSEPNVIEDTSRFSIAGVLFSLLPVKKLKLVRKVGRTISPAVRPVLNGGLLVLAAFGLTSCDDLTEPQIECGDDEFKLKSFRNAQCIDIPQVTVSYVDPLGNESSVHDGNPLNSVRVRFDSSDVGYLFHDGWRSLSDSVLSNIFDIRRTTGSGDASILNDSFAYSLVMDGSYFTFSPLEALSVGSYSVVVKNYAVRSDVGKILDSSNRSDYFNNVNVSFDFTVMNEEIEGFCDRNEPDYFRLQNSNGIGDCIKFPEVSYSYTPDGGQELIQHNGDPSTTINIRFDSEIAYLTSSEQGNITKQRILDMIDIRFGAEDIVEEFGNIGEDQVSYSVVDGKTIISIKPPAYGRGNSYDTLLQSEGINYFGLMVSVDNYANKWDVSKIANSSNLSEYLSDITETNFVEIARILPTSCNVTPVLGSHIQAQANTTELGSDFLCGTHILDYQRIVSGDYILSKDFATRDVGVHRDKADPNTTYQIDVAFIMSDESLVGLSLSDWKTTFNTVVIPNVNTIYQNSGVNVEFRIVVVPFSSYSQHLFCSVGSLDELSGVDKLAVLSELVPRIQRIYGVDLVYGITEDNNNSGIATIRPKSYPSWFSSRWNSVGHINSLLSLDSFITTLAHEIGHNLGLYHDKHTLINNINQGSGGEYPSPNIFHGSGYGYGKIESSYPNYVYGTIMSYAVGNEVIPVFSDDEAVNRSELCERGDWLRRYDYMLDVGFCPVNHHNPDEIITLGGLEDENGIAVTIDASEALQYTIEDASNYNTVNTVDSVSGSTVVQDNLPTL